MAPVPSATMKFPVVLAIVIGLATAARTGAADTLRVFAAASLTDAFRDLASAYERAHPGDIVELSFAGTEVLCAQIEQGAPADVLASADVAHMAALHEKRFVGAYRVFTRNKLVVIAPREGRVKRLQD